MLVMSTKPSNLVCSISEFKDYIEITKLKELKMNSVASKVAIMSVTVGLVGIAVYYNWEVITEISECVIYDNQKVKALHQLRKVRTVLQNFSSELVSAENNVATSEMQNIPIESKIKNLIGALSVDLDFILASLDKIEGDDIIKVERKKLVDKFNALSVRVDRLIEKIK